MSRVDFDTIERELLSHKVARRIVALIIEGKLQRGDRLPPERDLAQQMKVGRPAVREAVRALQMLNIIEVRQGKGTFIGSLEPASLIQPYALLLSTGGTGIVHLFEARRILEVGIASVAAERITDENVKGLRECLSNAREAIDDPVRFLELDMELHGAILEAAGNPVLVSIMTGLKDILRASRELTVTLRSIREHTLRDHERVVEALERRDPGGAAEAMADHLDYILKTYIGLKEERNNKAPA